MGTARRSAGHAPCCNLISGWAGVGVEGWVYGVTSITPLKGDVKRNASKLSQSINYGIYYDTN